MTEAGRKSAALENRQVSSKVSTIYAEKNRGFFLNSGQASEKLQTLSPKSSSTMEVAYFGNEYNIPLDPIKKGFVQTQGHQDPKLKTKRQQQEQRLRKSSNQFSRMADKLIAGGAQNVSGSNKEHEEIQKAIKEANGFNILPSKSTKVLPSVKNKN